MNFLKSQPFIA